MTYLHQFTTFTNHFVREKDLIQFSVDMTALKSI